MQNSHRRSIHLGILNAYGFQNNFKKYDKFNYKIRSSFYLLLLNTSKGFLCPPRSHRGQRPTPIIIINTREMNYHLHARPLSLREKYSQYPLQRSVVETQRLYERCRRETLLRYREIRPRLFICPVCNLSLYLLLGYGVLIT